jgi:hypothetical protein
MKMPSSPLAEASISPSGENATLVTGPVWPASVFISEASDTRHSFTVVSSLPDASS